MRPDLLISAARLRRRVRGLARRIGRDFAGRRPVLLGILQGARPFVRDLARALRAPHDVAFLQASSYGPAGRSSGRVRLGPLPRIPLRDRHLLVVEDVVDTGLTLRVLLARLRRERPASLSVCVLLDKPASRRSRPPLRYVGFRIPGVFAVGYGLDHAGTYRRLPYIGVLPGACCNFNPRGIR